MLRSTHIFIHYTYAIHKLYWKLLLNRIWSETLFYNIWNKYYLYWYSVNLHHPPIFQNAVLSFCWRKIPSWSSAFCFYGYRTLHILVNMSKLPSTWDKDDHIMMRLIQTKPSKCNSMTSVGFEPTPTKTTALTLRLRPLGHDVIVVAIVLYQRSNTYHNTIIHCFF